MEPIILVVSSVLDNEQLLCSTSGLPSGWQTPLEALVDDLASSMWHKIDRRVNFFVLPIALVL